MKFCASENEKNRAKYAFRTVQILRSLAMTGELGDQSFISIDSEPMTHDSQYTPDN